jgi:hypothetical protein
MHLPKDRVNITWGQLGEILEAFPDKLQEIERLDAVNNCGLGQGLEERVTKMIQQINEAI